jgi:hypothetical protein
MDILIANEFCAPMQNRITTAMRNGFFTFIHIRLNARKVLGFQIIIKHPIQFYPTMG